MPSHVYTLSPLSSSFGPMLCASITFCKHMINMQVCRRQLENPPQPASTSILHTRTHSHVLSDPLFQRWMNVCRNSRLNTDSYRGFQISLVIRVFFSLCLCVCLVPNSPRVGGWCRLQVFIVGVMLKEFEESPPNQLVALLPFTQSAGRRAHKTDVPRLEGEKHHVTQPARAASNVCIFEAYVRAHWPRSGLGIPSICWHGNSEIDSALKKRRRVTGARVLQRKWFDLLKGVRPQFSVVWLE